MCNSLAIITARGGSKRIPRKNVKNFLGYPIIKYPIEAAIESKCFDEVMVSTDDKEIALISKKFGAVVPFIRSQSNSGDFSTTADVIEEVLAEYRKRSRSFEYCCCIYPTAPFVTPQLLQKSFRVLKENKADAVLPVVCYSYPIQRALKIERGKVVMDWPENLNKRSQDLRPTYHDAGQFYWIDTKIFLKTKRILGENTVPIELKESEVQDIDDEDDWKIAEMKYRLSKG
jgi:pseudaminic acid cytidylyltransferase